MWRKLIDFSVYMVVRAAIALLQRLPDSPERDRLYREMDRLFFAYAPLRPIAHRVVTGFAQPWVVGYKRNGLAREFWTYLDIDESALPSPQSRGASAAAAPAR